MAATRQRLQQNRYLSLVLGGLAAALWVALVVWLVIPRNEFCVAIYPAPPGCALAFDARLPAATIAAVLLFGLGTLFVWVARRASRSATAWIFLGIFVAAAVFGYSRIVFA